MKLKNVIWWQLTNHIAGATIGTNLGLEIYYYENAFSCTQFLQSKYIPLYVLSIVSAVIAANMEGKYLLAEKVG